MTELHQETWLIIDDPKKSEKALKWQKDMIDKYGHLKRCFNCKHRQRWECGSKIFSYCEVNRSNRTRNKMMKCKPMIDSCAKWEAIEK